MLLFSRHSGRSLQRTLSGRLWLPASGSEPFSYSGSEQHLSKAQHDDGAPFVDAASLVGLRHSAGIEGFAAVGWLRCCSHATSEPSRNPRRSDVFAQGEHDNAPATVVYSSEGGQQLQPDTGSEAHEVFVDDDAASRQNHMRIVDRLRVDVAAGHGGRGCISFVKSATRGARNRHVQGHIRTDACSAGRQTVDVAALALDETV